MLEEDWFNPRLVWFILNLLAVKLCFVVAPKYPPVKPGSFMNWFFTSFSTCFMAIPFVL